MCRGAIAAVRSNAVREIVGPGPLWPGGVCGLTNVGALSSFLGFSWSHAIADCTAVVPCVHSMFSVPLVPGPYAEGLELILNVFSPVPAFFFWTLRTLECNLVGTISRVLVVGTMLEYLAEALIVPSYWYVVGADLHMQVSSIGPGWILFAPGKWAGALSAKARLKAARRAIGRAGPSFHVASPLSRGARARENRAHKK